MIKKFVPLFILVLFISTIAAQEVCPPFVQQAIERIGTSCVLTERNQACYGDGLIAVDPQPNVRLEPFDVAGDKVALTAVKALTLSPLNVDNNEWGLSVLQVQASLPDTLPGQNVTMIVSGDVSLENAGNAMEAFYFRGGIGAPGCASAPNGIVIQTPEGAGQVELTANNITFSLGSTLILETFDADGLQTRLDATETDAVEVADDATLLSYTLVEGSATLMLDDADTELAPLETSIIAIDKSGAVSVIASYPAPIEDFIASYGDILGVLPQRIDAELLTSNIGDTNGETRVTDGTCVAPTTGTWAVEIVSSDMSGCPEMGGAILDAMTSVSSQYLEFPDEFSVDALIALNPDMGAMGISTSEQLDTCTFRGTSIQESGISFQLTFTLQDENTILYDYNFNASMESFTCNAIINMKMTRTGD